MKKLLIILMLFLPLTALADDVEISDDKELAREIEAREKYERLWNNNKNKQLFLQSVAEVSKKTFKRCRMGYVKDCHVLVNLFTRVQPSQPTYCYAILITGYACEVHADEKACRFYKLGKKQCKRFSDPDAGVGK